MLISVWSRLRKNRGAVVALVLLAVFCLLSLLSPWISPYNPNEITEGALKLQPLWMESGSLRHLLGTDDLGRDFLSRLMYGGRISLGVGFLVVAISLSFGSFFGVLAGYVGGRVDMLIMRLVDIMMSIPSILLAIVVVAILGPSLINGVIAVSIVALPGYIRIVRAAVMTEKVKPYVTATRSFGAHPLRIIFINILPNCFAPMIVQASLGFSDGILNVAALGFLGLGAQPPTPEWGVMLADGKAYIESASWLVTLPGLCILIVVLSFNLLGDGLRDALDPKLKGSDH